MNIGALKYINWSRNIWVGLVLFALAIAALIWFLFSPSVPREPVSSTPSLELTMNDLSRVPEHGIEKSAELLTVEGQQVRSGDWYALELSDGTWRVVKVLRINDTSVYMAAYYDEFDNIPSSSSIAKLEKGYAHEMVPKSIFAGSKPHYLKSAEVTDDEFKAFQLWLVQ